MAAGAQLDDLGNLDEPGGESLRGRRLAGPQALHRADEVEQLERLGHMAGGPNLLGPAPGIGGRGHHHDRHVDTARAQRAGEAPAIHDRHAHIQQNGPRARVLNEPQRLGTVGGRANRVAFELEDLAYRGEDGRIVVDHQHVAIGLARTAGARGVHGAPPPLLAGSCWGGTRRMAAPVSIADSSYRATSCLDGKHHVEGAAMARRAGHPDSSTMLLDYAATDGQAEPHPGKLPVIDVCGAVETVEDVGQVARWDANPAIGNAQPYLIAFRPDPDRHRLTIG